MADMSRKSLVADLKASLHAAVEYFKTPADADYIRLLDLAAEDMGRVRPRRKLGTLTLVADQMRYPAPADLQRVIRIDWGRAERAGRQPWQPDWPHNLPNLTTLETDSGLMLSLSRPVTAAEIADLGASCEYLYRAAHVIGDTADATSIAPADRGLLLLRAQAEACRELAMRQIGKPMTLKTGIANQPRNGTPASLHEQLMKAWLEQAERRAA